METYLLCTEKRDEVAESELEDLAKRMAENVVALVHEEDTEAYAGLFLSLTKKHKHAEIGDIKHQVEKLRAAPPSPPNPFKQIPVSGPYSEKQLQTLAAKAGLPFSLRRTEFGKYDLLINGDKALIELIDRCFIHEAVFVVVKKLGLYKFTWAQLADAAFNFEQQKPMVTLGKPSFCWIDVRSAKVSYVNQNAFYTEGHRRFGWKATEADGVLMYVQVCRRYVVVGLQKKTFLVRAGHSANIVLPSVNSENNYYGIFQMTKLSSHLDLLHILNDQGKTSFCLVSSHRAVKIDIKEFNYDDDIGLIKCFSKTKEFAEGFVRFSQKTVGYYLYKDLVPRAKLPQ